jgi:hypothetical protein
MAAGYVPVCFPESFATCSTDELGAVVFIWLIPITASEADFAHRVGWERFEELLESKNPDLFDLFRPGVV